MVRGVPSTLIFSFSSGDSGMQNRGLIANPLYFTPSQRVSKDGGYELLLCVENAVAPAPFNSSMLSHHLPRQMPLAGRAAVVGITRPPSTAEDGGVPKASDTSGDGRAGAVVVDVGPDQHQALQHAERKVRTYGKALVGLGAL